MHEHRREQVVIEYNGVTSSRRRVRCCLCELPDTTRALFALPNDAFLAFCDDNGASIDPEVQEAQLARGQLVKAQMWQPQRSAPVVLVSAQTASARYLGGVAAVTFEDVESLAQTIFISDTVKLFTADGTQEVKSDADVASVGQSLEFIVNSSPTGPQITVHVDVRLQQLGRQGLLLLRAEPEQFTVESAESADKVIENIKAACAIKASETLQLLRLDMPLHDLEPSKFPSLQTAGCVGIERVLPWLRNFKLVTCNLICTQFMQLDNHTAARKRISMIVDMNRWQGLRLLAAELGRQLQIAPQVRRLTLKNAHSVTALPDTLDLFLEISVPVLRAGHETKEISVESEWTAAELMSAVRSAWSIPAQAQIRLSIQRTSQMFAGQQVTIFDSTLLSAAALSPGVAGEQLQDGVRVLEQLAPLDCIVVELQGKRCDMCDFDRVTVWHHLECGHTVCVHSICEVARNTAPFSEIEVKTTPPIPTRPASSTQDDTPAASFAHVARNLIRLADVDGQLLGYYEFKALQCPIQDCQGTIGHDVLLRIDAFVRAEQHAIKDQEQWQHTAHCVFEDIMACEPWPRESMYTLGSCTQHYYHHECLAGQLTDDIDKKRFDDLVCVGCQKDNSARPCDCPSCSLTEHTGIHRISEAELRFLCNLGLMTQPHLDRWQVHSHERYAANVAREDGNVIVECRNCPHRFLANPQWRNYRCNACRHIMCKECMQIEHVNETCDHARQRRLREAAAEHYGSINMPYQFCPRCHQPDGLPLDCAHATCRYCKEEFCFVCGCVREPTITHRDASFHRHGCQFHTTCCNDNCIQNGGRCQHDKFIPDKCTRCEQNGKVCQRPQNPAEGEVWLVHDYAFLMRRQREMLEAANQG